MKGIKKIKIAFAATVGAATLFALLTINTKSILELHSEQVTYGLSMNASQNRFNSTTGSESDSGTAKVKTNRGSEIEFNYTDLMGGSNTWHIVKSTGNFYNVDPINGLSNISFNFKTADKAFKLYWSQTTSFSDDKSVELQSSTSNEVTYNFNREFPSFFKFENTSGSNINISNINITFTCVPQNSFQVNASSENETMGTVTGSGYYKYDDEVTLVATPNTGVAFVGWLEGENLISSESSYTFAMPARDVSLTAHFEYSIYSVSVLSENEEQGTVSGNASYLYGQSVTIIATPNEGYGFAGWYIGDELFSSFATYTFSMPDHSLELIGKFDRVYTITLISDDEEMGEVSGPTQAVPTQEVTVTAINKNGCSFDYWCDADYNEVSYDAVYTFVMPESDVELHAVFKAGFDLIVTSSNTEKGTVSGGGLIKAGQSVTITATPNTGISFKGWYENNSLVSTEATYTFVMPERHLNYEGRFDDIIYTITFVTNGGSAINKLSLKYNETIPSVKTTRNGYTFVGWYTNSGLTQAYTIPQTMPAQNLTLYAKWKQIEYTVTVTGSGYVFSDDTSPGIWVGSRTGKYGKAGSFKLKSGETFYIDSNNGLREYTLNGKNVTPSNNSKYTVNVPLNKTSVKVSLSTSTYTGYVYATITY